MLADLRQHLETKGLDPSVLDDFHGVEESEVEVDALTEALDELTKAMKKDAAPSSEQASLFDDEDMVDEDMDDEDMDDEDMDDEDMDDEDMEKGGAYYADAMKALADGTDQVLASMEKRMGAVMKGLEAVLNEMKAMKVSNNEMNKSLVKSLNHTPAPRAVTSAPAAPVVPSAPPTPARSDVIRKGLRLLQSTNINNARKASIRGAISQLEAGVPVDSVLAHIDLDDLGV